MLFHVGVAQYRAGQWSATIEALQESMDLRSGGDGVDFLFTAMAHWQLGERQAAREWYDRGVEWMNQNKPDDAELRRFRAEAAELLGLTEEPSIEREQVTPED